MFISDIKSRITLAREHEDRELNFRCQVRQCLCNTAIVRSDPYCRTGLRLFRMDSYSGALEKREIAVVCCPGDAQRKTRKNPKRRDARNQLI